RTVRADRLAWVCTNPETQELVTRGIAVVGLRIDGSLDLEWAHVSFPLTAKKCVFTGNIVLRDSRLRSLNLNGSYIKVLSGDGMEVERDVLLCDGFKAEGEVGITLATIGGNLDCYGGRFFNS